MSKTIADVRQFWESNPLWTGESRYKAGTREFFEEHRQVYIEDCYAGDLNPSSFPPEIHTKRVLDLGCGPGFWLIEFTQHGYERVFGADLTGNALKLSRQRCSIYQTRANLCQQNAERLAFADQSFAHINCIGVIHHTPNTAATVAEIARILEPGGTASISVYYRNIILRNWHRFSWAGKWLAKLGAGLQGRGREDIYRLENVDEIVRLYDGVENPIGKSYTSEQFRDLLVPHFTVEKTYLYFFPARSLPLPVPNSIHRILNNHFGFMICADVIKP